MDCEVVSATERKAERPKAASDVDEEFFRRCLSRCQPIDGIGVCHSGAHRPSLAMTGASDGTFCAGSRGDLLSSEGRRKRAPAGTRQTRRARARRHGERDRPASVDRNRTTDRKVRTPTSLVAYSRDVATRAPGFVALLRKWRQNWTPSHLTASNRLGPDDTGSRPRLWGLSAA